MGAMKQLYLECEIFGNGRAPGSWPIPYETRVAVLIRANGSCEDCLADYPLELHHLHYRTVGEEEPDDLLALCRDCHHQRHRLISGQFSTDPEEVEREKEAFAQALWRD